MTMLEDVKKTLRQTQNDDDDLLTRLIESATMEYVKFTGMEITSSIDAIEINDDAYNGIILMVQADYDGDPLMREKYRAAAEALWMPYAVNDRMAL